MGRNLHGDQKLQTFPADTHRAGLIAESRWAGLVCSARPGKFYNK